jgi:hypothetical protein
MKAAIISAENPVTFDDQVRDTLERITVALRAQLERELAPLADDLKRVTVEERERAARAAAEVDALKSALSDERERAAQQAAETAAADMRRQADVQAQIAQVHDSARRRIEEIQRAAAEERDRAVQQATEAAAVEARRQADGQIAQLREAAQRHAEEIRRAAETQVGELRTTLQAQLEEVRRAAHAQSEEERRSAHAEIEDARRAAAAQVDDVQRAARAEAEEIVIAQLAAAHADAERKIGDAIDRTRTDVLQAELAHTARLLDAIRRLDDARSLGEALDTLAECAGRQVERAALLVVRGDKLRVHRLAGFASERPADDLSVHAAGVAGAVVSTGVAVSRAAVEPGEEQSSRQPALPVFAQDAGGRHAVALPIVVGGQVVAVLYADAPRTHAPSAASRWPATLEVLARHASRALEAMTVQRASGLSLPRPTARPSRSALPGPVEQGGTGDEDAARRYARLLVSEIRMYHEPLVDAGRRSRDLRTRLCGEIDRARRLYEERVPQTVRERSDYFEQELVRTLADGDRSLLG